MPSPRVRRLKRAKKVAKANGSKVQVVEEKLEPAIKVEPIVEEKVQEKPKRKRKPKIVAEAPPAEAKEEEPAAEEEQSEPEQSEEE